MYTKCYVLYITLAVFLTQTNVVFAQNDNQQWSKTDIANLNVIKDLKQGTGRVWYVDGKNGDDGTGDGYSLKTPWKTIGKAVGYLKAGDTIAIGAGTYRERLFINKKGTEGNRILIGPRGDGEVIIDASDKVTGWTLYQGDIYKAPCPFQPTAVVVDDEPLFPEFSMDKVDVGKWYYDKNNKMLFLYVPGGGNPHSHDIGIISDNQYQDGVLINDASYITLYGLTVRFAGGRGISILGAHNKVEKCYIKFNGHTGVNLFNYRDIVTDNTIVVKSHIYHNFLRNWPRGRYKWGSWGGGAISHGTPNTHYIGNIVHKNGGEGLLAYGGGGGTIFRDNIVYDNWSVNIYVDNQPNCTIERNLVYCNEPAPTDLYNNGDKNPRDNKNLRRLRAEGIMTADENSPATFQNAKIVNNLIIGCRRGINHYAKGEGSGIRNVLVANNTIIVPDAKGVDESYIGIDIPYNNGNNTNAVYRDNIIYASHPDTYLLHIATNPLIKNDIFHGLTFDHNLWYHSGNKKPFHVGPTWGKTYDISFEDWINMGKSYEQCRGSIYENPKFKNIIQYSADMVKLMADSPAIDKGIAVEEAPDDFEGNLRDKKPDIGAFEFIP